MRARVLLVAISCVSWAIVEACGGSTDDTLDGSTDGTTETTPPPPDSGGNDVVNPDDTGTGDTGTTDGGGDAMPTDASDGGAQDSGTTIGTWKCGATTVTNCSQCTGYTQPCVYCAVTDASVLSGVCTLINSNCYTTIPTGYGDCACADASTCPESYQVCTNFGRCHTCSDSTQNNGLSCENGGTCDSADGGCL
jgi:hypothetical protein